MQSGTKELSAQECGTWEGLSKGGGSGLWATPPHFIWWLHHPCQAGATFKHDQRQ